MLAQSIKALFRIVANHCPIPGLRHLMFRWSGISMGEKCYINMGLTVVDDYRGGLIVGNRVAIAPNVTVIISSNPNYSELNKISSLIKFEKVIIEDDAWIGANVAILPGVKIGRASIVGAGSVVTKDVNPYEVVAGNPAALIRKISPE